MTRDEMIEVMARAIAGSGYEHGGIYVEACTKLAQTALSALEAAGYVVARKKPTEAMLDAGYWASKRGRAVDREKNAYAAMLSASQQEKTDG